MRRFCEPWVCPTIRHKDGTTQGNKGQQVKTRLPATSEAAATLLQGTKENKGSTDCNAFMDLGRSAILLDSRLGLERRSWSEMVG